MPDVNPVTTALVTGAASGIGRHIAATLASRGAQVAALDINSDGLTSLANTHPRISAHVCDVADDSAVRDTVKLALDNGAPLKAVVHCAGVAPLSTLPRPRSRSWPNITGELSSSSPRSLAGSP
jgi:NAD(P)-dependent dehydrogenase (short-subunit alcohol dehydrogenase family)